MVYYSRTTVTLLLLSWGLDSLMWFPDDKASVCVYDLSFFSLTTMKNYTCINLQRIDSALAPLVVITEYNGAWSAQTVSLSNIKHGVTSLTPKTLPSPQIKTLSTWNRRVGLSDSIIQLDFACHQSSLEIRIACKVITFFTVKVIWEVGIFG